MRNKLTDELAVCGLNAVLALAEKHSENINRLFLREDRLKLFTGLCKKLAERKRPYKMCDDAELERICKSHHHQGVVAMMVEPDVLAADEEFLSCWAAEGKTGLLICDVGNDNNLGAIVRSAAFFDAPLIVLTEPREARAETRPREHEPRSKNTAPPSPAAEVRADAPGLTPREEKPRLLTTSAYRVAEGGMEHVQFRSVRNPAAFLRSASKTLVSIGTDPRARVRIRDLPALIAAEGEKLPLKNKANGKCGVVLAVGNEEHGLPKSVKDACTLLARVPGTGNVESLNVAQAATLFLQELYER